MERPVLTAMKVKLEHCEHIRTRSLLINSVIRMMLLFLQKYHQTVAGLMFTHMM